MILLFHVSASLSTDQMMDGRRHDMFVHGAKKNWNKLPNWNADVVIENIASIIIDYYSREICFSFGWWLTYWMDKTVSGEKKERPLTHTHIHTYRIYSLDDKIIDGTPKKKTQNLFRIQKTGRLNEFLTPSHHKRAREKRKPKCEVEIINVVEKNNARKFEKKHQFLSKAGFQRIPTIAM